VLCCIGLVLLVLCSSRLLGGLRCWLWLGCSCMLCLVVRFLFLVVGSRFVVVCFRCRIRGVLLLCSFVFVLCRGLFLF